MNVTGEYATATPFPTSELLHNAVDRITSSTSTIDVITVAVAIVALIVSIISLILSFLQSRKAQKLTLEAEYFQIIFKEYLVTKFPNAREKIFFSEGTVSGHNEFISQVNALRRGIYYFRYADAKFYGKLKTKLQNLEDFILSAMNKQYDNAEQVTFNSECDKQLSSIYKLITKRYYGM